MRGVECCWKWAGSLLEDEGLWSFKGEKWQKLGFRISVFRGAKRKPQGGLFCDEFGREVLTTCLLQGGLTSGLTPRVAKG